MDERVDDQLFIEIDKKLCDHTERSLDCCIFRVPRHVRNVNKEAYEPLMVAIGPYHHHDDQLRGMEEHKLHCLKVLLQRTGKDNLKRYIEVMRSMEKRARSFYAEVLSDIPEDKFVEMMLLDSCFIFEVIRELKVLFSIDKDGPIFGAYCVDNAVIRDLSLVENQLPFFVLMEFFQMTNVQNEHTFSSDFIEMIYFLLCSMLPSGMKILNRQALNNPESIRNSRHLLGLLHTICLSPFLEIEKKWEFIPSATRLKEAGIMFKKGEAHRNLFDIKFENGVLEIPTLIIVDLTECFFRNLIAYEELFPRENSYFVDYITFIDCLINTGEDVELLRDCGIIDNWLGDEKAVASMFNTLVENITVKSSNFSYSKLFNQVNKYCRRPCNIWMANLRHNYFNSPWALISVLAATLLLLLALAQTVFSVLAYKEY